MQTKLRISLKNAEWNEKSKFALLYLLAMDVGERTASGSDHFISCFPCKEVLKTLDVTVILMTNYWKGTHNYKIKKKESERKNCLSSWKALHNITKIYKLTFSDTGTIFNLNKQWNPNMHVLKFPVQTHCLISRSKWGFSQFSLVTTENAFRYLTVVLSSK
jgi:hypothetical protein